MNRGTTPPEQTPTVDDDRFRRLIEQGDVQAVKRALEQDPGLANSTIRWRLNQDNESDPLHYVSDCVGHGWLADDRAGEIAGLLLACGARIEGSEGRESPLIASASLAAQSVSSVLIRAGAALEATSVFGARALHWAAWMGAAATVELLVSRGAEIEARDAEFGATPLFWAVHGYGPNGPQVKQDQVGAARLLIRAGASVATTNSQGLSALDLAKSCGRADLYELLRRQA